MLAGGVHRVGLPVLPVLPEFSQHSVSLHTTQYLETVLLRRLKAVVQMEPLGLLQFLGQLGGLLVYEGLDNTTDGVFSRLEILPHVLADELQHHPAAVQHGQRPDGGNVCGENVGGVDARVQQLGVQHGLQHQGSWIQTSQHDCTENEQFYILASCFRDQYFPGREQPADLEAGGEVGPELGLAGEAEPNVLQGRLAVRPFYDDIEQLLDPGSRVGGVQVVLQLGSMIQLMQ